MWSSGKVIFVLDQELTFSINTTCINRLCIWQLSQHHNCCTDKNKMFSSLPEGSAQKRYQNQGFDFFPKSDIAFYLAAKWKLRLKFPHDEAPFFCMFQIGRSMNLWKYLYRRTKSKRLLSLNTYFALYFGGKQMRLVKINFFPSCIYSVKVSAASLVN
jgi:hypothetical protein